VLGRHSFGDFGDPEEIPSNAIDSASRSTSDQSNRGLCINCQIPNEPIEVLVGWLAIAGSRVDRSGDGEMVTPIENCPRHLDEKFKRIK